MSDEREDWDDLLRCKGWQRLLTYAKEQWGGAAYKSRIKQAQTFEDVKAIDRVSDELNILLTHPKERMDQLDKVKEQAATVASPSRRGGL